MDRYDSKIAWLQEIEYTALNFFYDQTLKPEPLPLRLFNPEIEICISFKSALGQMEAEPTGLTVFKIPIYTHSQEWIANFAQNDLIPHLYKATNGLGLWSSPKVGVKRDGLMLPP
ncbi:MAG: hypothetical protein P1S59_14530 [bacterium]|nr:hypothetical protein [bacterium]